MSDSAQITITGTITSTPEASGPADLALTMSAGALGFRIISAGDTLEGFSPGDHQTFTGQVVRVTSFGRIVVRV